ncbi:MAG TPA: hypothetical protein VLG67_04545 [Candidatus Saccharimonadales bacterium]|nr:hypothetical protein [Candidatus Saccharimonadales bacterium]
MRNSIRVPTEATRKLGKLMSGEGLGGRDPAALGFQRAKPLMNGGMEVFA